MIVYRKASQLRVRRSAAPAPPFWCASTIAPYSNRRGLPVAIDYLDLRASFTEKLEVTVTEQVRAELERASSRLAEPVLIEASEFAEEVFRRGSEALAFCAEEQRTAVYLTSTRGALPEAATADTTIVISAWPLELDRLERLCAEANERQLRWGLAVPVIYPVTTNLAALAQLCELAKAQRAEFLAAIPVELDPTAKQSIAQTFMLDDEDDETYAMLFHADLEPIHVATERHLAALAHDAGLADFIVPPHWERRQRRSNWNAAILLTLTAARMMAMGQDVELAGTLARSARLIAELDKPIERVAEAASLAIIDALDEASVDILTEWLSDGRAAFVDRVNERWRLRRDYGA